MLTYLILWSEHNLCAFFLARNLLYPYMPAIFAAWSKVSDRSRVYLMQYVFSLCPPFPETQPLILPLAQILLPMSSNARFFFPFLYLFPLFLPCIQRDQLYYLNSCHILYITFLVHNFIFYIRQNHLFHERSFSQFL